MVVVVVSVVVGVAFGALGVVFGVVAHVAVVYMVFFCGIDSTWDTPV